MSTTTRNPFFINSKLCSHLTDYKCVNDYNTLKRYIKTIPNGRTRVVRHSSEQPRCIFCSLDSSRLYLCLICDSISCFEHALLHSQMNDGHDLAVDVQRSELYCCACNDQVYDPDFDKVVMRIHIFNSNLSSSNGSGGSNEVRLSKRRKLSLIGLDFGAMGSVKDRREKSCFPLGLRGLNNLGNTCFMNSVLQALLHTPPLRNYFLSNRHNRLTCRTRSMDRMCLPCDIDKLFSAVFSGDRTPYSPAQFLYSWWQHSANLATYEQQDAHEFFISMLDLIHEKDNKERNLSKDNGDCPCIAHRVFSGLLRSDVTCTTCGFTSTTYDPCVDISLDLDIAPSSKDGAKKTTKPSEHTSMSTLAGCLDLFTRPEKLGSDQKLYCQNCRERRDSLKQMSIRRLPLVLCLHIKRFEHSHIRKMSRKIDRYMQFPFSLDMSPYLSSSIVSNRFGNRMFPFEGDETETSTEYEVFAVVTHSGMLESGHYVSYLRLRNQWYKCDDAWITEVDEPIVRASQCYLLYYVQKVLYNKANEDFSCFPLSPRGDSFVPIAGCC